MGMTMTQKILAAHAGLESVVPGQLIEADLDLVLANDITGPVAIHEVEKLNKKTVFDKDKIALVPDHFAPNKDIKSAEHCKCVCLTFPHMPAPCVLPCLNPYQRFHIRLLLKVRRSYYAASTPSTASASFL